MHCDQEVLSQFLIFLIWSLSWILPSEQLLNVRKTLDGVFKVAIILIKYHEDQLLRTHAFYAIINNKIKMRACSVILLSSSKNQSNWRSLCTLIDPNSFRNITKGVCAWSSCSRSLWEQHANELKFVYLIESSQVTWTLSLAIPLWYYRSTVHFHRSA